MTGTAALWIITPVLNALTQPANAGKKMQHWFVHICGVVDIDHPAMFTALH